MFICLLLGLCQIWRILLVEASPTRVLRSPCPGIFRYERVSFVGNTDWVFPSEDHKWRGTITVPPSLPVFLKVKLIIPAVLPFKYAGRIELAEDKTEIVRKVNEGSLDKIKYYVYFPTKIPIPELILIEVNSRVICSQASAPRRLKTILTLEHSLMPITTNVSVRGVFGDGTLKNLRLPTKGFKESSSPSLKQCGKSILKNPFLRVLVSASIEDWPWMVPLFKKTELGLHFLCSSTLASREFVITAGHCIKFKTSRPLKKEDIVAYAGRFDLTKWTEENTQPRELSEIFIHPDFDPETLYSDLAILKFSKPVEFSPKVSPACLWSGDEDLRVVEGKKGIIFGWGTDGLGHKITPTPNLAVMPIVSQEECLRSKVDFLFLTSNRTFCAGFRNGTGPCSGDSGGGLLLPTAAPDGSIRWVLRGVVSLSLLQSTQIMCNVQEYTVFTDIAKYQNWMSEIMGTSK